MKLAIAIVVALLLIALILNYIMSRMSNVEHSVHANDDPDEGIEPIDQNDYH